MVGQGLAGVEEALSALVARGKRVRVLGSPHSLLPLSDEGSVAESVELEMGTRVDRVVRRCMVKITLNYLAFVVTEKLRSTDWLLRPDFDVVREFVRQDSETMTPLVSTEIQLESQDLTGGKIELPLGHSATVVWSRHGADIEAKISLFSRFSWRVTLSRSFSGVS